VSAERATVEQAAGRGGFLIGSAHLLRSLILLVGHTLVLPRLLDPEDFGLVGAVVATIGVVTIFRDPGLSRVTIQRPKLGRGDLNTLFWINTGLGAVILLACAALAVPIASFYADPRLAAITVWLAVTVLVQGLTVQHLAVLNRRLAFGSLAAIDLTAVALQMGSTVAFAAAGSGYWALVWGRLVAVVVRAVGAWTLGGWLPGRPRWTKQTADMLRFGRHVTGFNLVNYLARNFDDVLVARLFGMAPLGLYQRAYEIYYLPHDQASQPMGRVALTSLSRLADSPDRYREIYLRFVRIGYSLAIPFGAVMFVLCDRIVPLVLGPAWAGVVPIVRPLLALLLLEPLMYPTGWLFMSQDRTSEMARWGLISAALSVLSVVAGAAWGVVGVAVAYAIVGLGVRGPMLVWWAGRRGPVPAAAMVGAAGPFIAAGLAVVGAGLLVSAAAGESLGGGMITAATQVALFVGLVALSPRAREPLVALPGWLHANLRRR
jgi:PST family polysaccharide transporter